MNKNSFVAGYLFTVLFVSSCSGGNLQTRQAGVVSASESTQQAAVQAKNSNTLRAPGELVDAVKNAYTDLTYYGSKGTHQVREEVRGKRTEYQGIPFEVEYRRHQDAALRWKENDLDKVLTIKGRDSWLEVAGQRQRTFSTPDDAIQIGPKTGENEILFAARYFVFRDELQLGDKFFSGLSNLESNAEEVVDGHPCSVLTGTYRNVDVRNTYWIDNETGVIRRIQQIVVIRTKSEGKEYVSTTTTTENYTNIELVTGRQGI
jgi:hypothetical protein